MNIVTSVGHDPVKLHHFIVYYKSIGVDDFHVVVWGDSEKVPYDDIVAVLDSHDLSVYKDYRDIQINDIRFLSNIYNEAVTTKPDEWWIVADLDEFNIFPDSLEDYITKLDSSGQTHAKGIMLDRIGVGGALSELQMDDVIWEKFPNVGYISKQVRHCAAITVPLFKKGDTNLELGIGQHRVDELLLQRQYTGIDVVRASTIEKDNLERGNSFWQDNTVETHHFRWSKLDHDLLKDTENWWVLQPPQVNMHRELQREVDYLEANPTIDMSNALFLVDGSPHTDKAYGGYEHWQTVIDDPANSWQAP